MTSKKLQLMLSCFLLSILLTGFYSCGNDAEKPETIKKDEDYTVRIMLSGNIDVLNIVLSQLATSSEILDANVHAGLLDLDPQTFAVRPYMAKSRPEINVLDNGKMTITYEIREEATWDNGTPITAADYIFTLKAIKNPKVGANSMRPFLEFIEDVETYEDNPRKFTVVCNQPYLLSENASGMIAIMPAYFYDPQGLMTDITIKDLNDPEKLKELANDPRIMDFANDFNNNYNHDPEKIVGAGPYQVAEIVANQHVRLKRKKEWWGDKVDEDYIVAYPPNLFFRIITDDNNALMSLKEKELDVMTYISAENFLDLKDNPRVNEHFNLYTPNGFAYRYIGMNMKNPKLSDVRVRQALAHLIDKDYIVKEVSNDLVHPVTGPISPFKAHYNKNIKDRKLDPEKAKALLAEAGWEDSNGDNVLDKMINGKLESLEMDIKYPVGKSFYKDVSQILKDEAERVGIKLNLRSSEFGTLKEDMQKRAFDLVVLGWGQTPMVDDLKQIWHTESDTENGNNMVGFGTPETDALIDEIRTTMDEAKRKELYFRFQEIVHEQQPYIFLVAPKMCTAISKKFKNAKSTALRPGYFAREFQLAD